MFQTLSIAESWRSLALMGRLEPASIKAGLVDSGFNPAGGTFAPVDYPQFKISYDINDALLDLEAVPITQVGTWAGYANTFDQFSRVASASRHICPRSAPSSPV
jgi:hypothetical protein